MGRNIRLYLLLSFLVICLGVLVNYRSMAGYLLEQARGQWHIIWRAKPIATLLEKKNLSPHLQARLREVESIKAFSVDSLQFNVDNTYESLYFDDPPLTMWVVSACKPYIFEEKVWEFPLVGSFPYKGFFNKASALQAVEKLKKEGYDTYLSTADGWSTLNWLPNPLTMKMLQRPVGSLANLILHELTHNNLYVKDNALLNENIASFVGHRGAIAFLVQHYGVDAPETRQYLVYWKDRERYFQHVLRGMRQLQRLYEHLPEEVAQKDKQTMKDAIIACIYEEMKNIDFHNDKWKIKVAKNKKLLNNAFFISCRNYYKDQEKLAADFEESRQTLAEYIRALKKQYE